MEKASIFSAAGLPPPGLARPPAPACPHPATRAPRAPEGEACARLYPAPAALAGALVAVVCRDIRGLGLTDAQRLSHFCASPLLALSWFQDFEVGVVRERGGLPCWTPYGASVVLSGSQSHPFTSWAPSAGRGGMVCMTADAVRALFGLDPSTLQDRFVPAHGLLGRAWWPFLDALVAAPDDAATLAVLAQYLGPRWQAECILSSKRPPSANPGHPGPPGHYTDNRSTQNTTATWDNREQTCKRSDACSPSSPSHYRPAW